MDANDRTCAVCGDNPCYVHCIYCGVDCELPEVVHADDCPSVTGVYPVRESDGWGPVCPHCEKHVGGGMACPFCQTELEVGDFYTHIDAVPPGEPEGGIPVRMIVCLGCAALGRKMEDLP